MLFPPSKTNHIAVNHVHLAYYPPIISLFIFMIGYLVDVYNKYNYLDFGIGMSVFPFVLGSFVVWLHFLFPCGSPFSFSTKLNTSGQSRDRDCGLLNNKPGGC